MNPSARENILARLRQSPTTTPTPTAPVKITERNHQEMITRFCEMMRAVHGEIHHTSAEEWPILLNVLIRKKNIDSLLVSSKTKTGKTVIKHNTNEVKLYYADKPIEEYKQALFEEINASLTDCRGGVAETGSLILWPSKEEPRTMSLVPPIHFVLLDQHKIYNTWAKMIAAEHWNNIMPTNALLISGPSKTADIQQTLAYGAHGPKELIVFMI